MNCKAFERCLDGYVLGTLSPGEYYRANQHLRECPACEALVRLLESGQHCPALDTDLSGGILHRTSGDSCRRATELLCDLADGELDQVQAQLVSGHVEHCPRCASLACTLSELTSLLPQMREIVPAPPLVQEVLAVTTALNRKPAGFLGTISLLLSGLLQRPRFSWEAAYLGTLVIFALFGTPFSPLPDAGPRMLAALQQQDGLVSIAADNLAGVYRSVELGRTGIRKTTDRLTLLRERTNQSIDSWWKTGQDRVAQAGNRLAAMKATSRRVLNDLSTKVKLERRE